MKIISGLGLDTGLIGNTAGGDTGNFLCRSLSEDGVRTWFTVTDRAVDTRVVLLGTDGTRTILESQSSPVNEPVPDMKEEILGDTGTLFLSLDGRASPGSLRKSAEKAAGSGMKIILELPMTGLLFTERNAILSLAGEYADLVIISEEAAAVLSESPEKPAPVDTARSFGTDVVLAGIRGASFSDGVEEVHFTPDGAAGMNPMEDGSAFSAGFLYELLSGSSMEKCLETGLKIAQAISLIPGMELSRANLLRIRAGIMTATAGELTEAAFTPAEA